MLSKWLFGKEQGARSNIAELHAPAVNVKLLFR